MVSVFPVVILDVIVSEWFKAPQHYMLEVHWNSDKGNRLISMKFSEIFWKLLVVPLNSFPPKLPRLLLQQAAFHFPKMIFNNPSRKQINSLLSIQSIRWHRPCITNWTALWPVETGRYRLPTASTIHFPLYDCRPAARSLMTECCRRLNVQQRLSDTEEVQCVNYTS